MAKRGVQIVTGLLVCVGLLPVAADESGKAKRPLKIGIITNEVAPFWNPMVKGMNDAGERLGVQVQWQGPTPGSVAKQREIIDSFRAQQFDGIAISPRESGPLTPVINELVDNGTVVLTIDSDAPESKRLAYIGTHNYNAGKTAGEAAVRLLPSGGKAVAFVGVRAAQNARERIAGFVEATREHGIELLDVREDQGDKAKARRNVEDAIQAFPQATAFLGVWSYNAPAIAAAVLAAGKRDALKIIGFDAEPQTLQHLEKGDIDICIGQRPYLFGYLSVLVLHNLLAMGIEEASYILPPDRIIDTGVDVITPENLEQYKQQLAKWGIKSS